MKKLKKSKKIILPKFKNEDEERKFWDKISLADFARPKDLKRVVFPNLKPSTQPISLRLPISVIFNIKQQANSLGVPYQSLMKQDIANGIAQRSFKVPAKR